ncbi:cell envelope integrity protein TolA [Massilia sp. GER05]|uniref:cell envelope integrity protein TolA n=1 Tax=Massilia sp. GER05 TaxID=3394605 RepID=UPI003F85BC8A
MFADDTPRLAPAFGPLRRHPFIVLSLVLHAVPLVALYHFGTQRIEIAQRERQQRQVESGAWLTVQARLEKRVHDMARIQSLLAQSAGKQPAGNKEDEVQFSAQPKAPDELLKQAKDLARKIDEIERDTKAEQLAKLLDIPKEKALEQVAEKARAEAPPAAEPRTPAEAAAQIEQLEAKARVALEERRHQLEQQQNGVQVAADAAGAAQRGAGKGNGKGKGKGNGEGKGDGQGNGQSGQGLGNGSAGGVGRQMLDRIAAFTNPDLPDRMTKAYLGGAGTMFGGGVAHMPTVDAATMVKGTGRMIGAGGTYANRVWVNRWYLIGPFDGRHGAGLFANYHHPPEQGVVLDAAYRGKGGRLVKWDYVDMARYPLEPPVHAEDAVYYGYTELMLDAEQDLTIWVGADDDVQLWLNDRLVWEGGNANKDSFFGQVYETRNTFVRDYNLNEGKRVVHFRKGRNKLFFKLSNGPTRIFFSLVLTK